MSERAASYTTIEAAKLLGISPASVQRWVDAGHLKAWKTLGGHRRIDADSVSTLLAAQEAEIPSALADQAANQAAKQGDSAQALSLLLVDDDDIARELLEMQVRLLLPRAHLLLAENGFQALMMAGRSAPDVVITDMVMPHMNGIEMIRQLRASPKPPLIIAVSSQSRENLARLGGLPDEVLLLAKPVEQALLAGALDSFQRDRG
ncbi:response regulator [Paucibacter sp. B2R-40]|uniref:response regulator n=1 Tax=Paucibacter sp. B2R-40 TaxID=2893554 RepID=UPI0021E384FF|nr:response regulator [Paucibacter sp. B2R-40]MCV2354419.1 response regulator [Paucibacter sp. B2R-40]